MYARLVAHVVAFGSLGAFALAGLNGCNSGTVAAPSIDQTVVEQTNPTYAGSIESIVSNRCATCHHEGGIAPFPLETYEQVKAMGALAREKVTARDMPPWGAYDEEGCNVQRKFKDDLRLSDQEIQKFSAWVDAGMPLGTTAQTVQHTYPAQGLPDKTNSFHMPKPHAVSGNASDDIRCFPIDPGFTEDTWVGGTNVLPGDPRVVHHVIVYTDPNGQGQAKADAAGGDSYPCFGDAEVDGESLLLAWAPGVPPTEFPEDAGLKVAKGSHLVMQIHYHPTNVTVNDATSFEIKTLVAKPSYIADILLIGNADDPNGKYEQLLPGPNDPASGPKFLIPANKAGHTEKMQATMPETVDIGGGTKITIPPISVAAVGSHMHWAGTDLKIEIDRKNPTAESPAHECLLSTPKYNFNWQRAYQYDSPIEDLPVVYPGDRLTFTCTYDNTLQNPNIQKALVDQHRDSPIDIKLGETTLDEMCLGVLVGIHRASAIDL